MEKYEQISVVGEGSYGLVMKCRHRETDQIVAVKKFLETEEDATVRKMALREIRMLKRLKHENLVTMIEVFRYRKRFYLVFEYVEGTVLDELEKMPGGLGEERSRERIFQITRAVHYCHSNNIIHRDVKPENVLVSSLGIVKLCDFGFARLMTASGEPCTEYVATRWYRAPELLVGEASYGSPVDIWALGCLFAEMMTGDPVFPGESDIDQLYLIVRLLGKPCNRHQHLMTKNTQLRGMIKSANPEDGLYKNYPTWPLLALDFLSCCLKMDPLSRLTADELLKHTYFSHDRFPQRFLPIVRDKVTLEFNSNPLLRKFKSEVLMSTDKVAEFKIKKPLQTEQFRWKLNLVEGSMKRKLSSEINTSDDKNLITLSKTSQRLNVVQNSGLTKQNSLLTPKDKYNKHSISTPKLTQSNNNATELQLLEKSLEGLTKFSQKCDISKHEQRPASSRENSSSPSALLPPSPPQFQSLQQNFAFGDFTRSMNTFTTTGQNTLHTLHPSINNITFNKFPPKKSPSVLQTLNNNNNNNKFTINQAPLFSHKGHFLKKERSNAVEPMGDYNIRTGGSWLLSSNNNNNNNGNMQKKNQTKVRDEFTLPTLPGATISPSKLKKKSLPDIEPLQSTQVTPAYRYKKAKRKLQTLDISLPLSVKEKG